MRVHMDCAGCETKIKKALQKLDGTYPFIHVEAIHGAWING